MHATRDPADPAVAVVVVGGGGAGARRFVATLVDGATDAMDAMDHDGPPAGTRLHAPPHRARADRASVVAASIHPTGIRRRRRHIASTPRAPPIRARSCDALQLSGET
jgi:hypothetical protein